VGFDQQCEAGVLRVALPVGALSTTYGMPYLAEQASTSVHRPWSICSVCSHQGRYLLVCLI
jgi:hypothetical protein